MRSLRVLEHDCNARIAVMSAYCQKRLRSGRAMLEPRMGVIAAGTNPF
jgi:hypothetical protein